MIMHLLEKISKNCIKCMQMFHIINVTVQIRFLTLIKVKLLQTNNILFFVWFKCLFVSFFICPAIAATRTTKQEMFDEATEATEATKMVDSHQYFCAKMVSLFVSYFYFISSETTRVKHVDDGAAELVKVLVSVVIFFFLSC